LNGLQESNQSLGYIESVVEYSMDKQSSARLVVISMPHPKAEWEDSVQDYREQERLRWERKKWNQMKGEKIVPIIGTK
jgi:hypothetical protein